MPSPRSRLLVAASAIWTATLVVLLLAAGPAGATTPPAQGVTVVDDVPYGNGAQLLLDVYRPANAVDLPVVILIHGGGWNQGDKDDFSDESRTLAKTGFIVFDINYTLRPEDKAAYPRQVTDMHTALEWVQANSATYGGDPARIGVLGGSAGGYLAAMLAFQSNDATAQPVKALVSLSGPLNLPLVVEELEATVRSADGTCSPAPCDVVEGATNSLSTLLGCSPVECPEELIREASPATYVDQYSPPSYLANSTDEVVRPDQSSSTADLLRQSGVTVETAVVPGAFHSAGLLPTVGPDVLSFLTTHVVNAVVTASPTASPPASTQPPVAATPTRSERHAWRWYVLGGALLILVIAVVARRATSSAGPEQP